MEMHHSNNGFTPSIESGISIVRSFREIVEGATPGVIHTLFEHPGLPFRSFPLIWVVGPAASGKSTVASFLHTTFPDVPVIHDRHALTAQLEKKKEGASDPTLPTVVDKGVLTAALDTVIHEASHAPTALIELARGGSEHSESNPMSFDFALTRIPEPVLRKSLFIYLNTPFEVRMLRNDQRPEASSQAVSLIPEVRCSDDTMHRVFKYDDGERLTRHPQVTFIQLTNTRSRSELLDVLNFLFGRNQ